MATVNGCNLPEDLYYLVDGHVWCRPDGDLAVVGITDVAQHLARTIIAVTPKRVGRVVDKGQSLATVESGKWVGPVPSPVSGEIVEINEAVVRDPATINRDCYEAGWIAKVRAQGWATEAAELATGSEGVEAYGRFLDAEGISCSDA
jgi:glycine cleavage system H protein